MLKYFLRPSALATAAVLTFGSFHDIFAAQKPGTPVTSDLRGYGKVTATLTPQRSVFECEDEAHADILLGKLPADLFWDAGSAHRTIEVEINGRRIPVHHWTPYGYMAIGATGRQVWALGADDLKTLTAGLRAEPLLRAGNSRFASPTPYPLYLDFYDLKAFKAYTHAMKSTRKEGLDSHWPFVRQSGMGGIASQGLSLGMHCPAPGVVQWSTMDYELLEAERQGGMFVVCPAVGGELPLWLYNRNPDATAQPSPNALIGAWGGPGSAGAHYENFGNVDPASRTLLMDFQYRVMERYRHSGNLGGWHLYTGQPGVEFGLHDLSGDLLDYSPAGQEGMRRWLREERGFDLATLGRRWYGNPAHYRSWQEVNVPDIMGFFGNLGAADNLRLPDDWYWKKAAEKDDAVLPPFDRSSWIPLIMQPSQQQDFLPWGAAYYRNEFNAGKWPKTGVDAFLVCATWVRSRGQVRIWLNGKEIGAPLASNKGGRIPLAVKLPPGTLKEQKNELIIRVPSGVKAGTEGKIFGPVFFTAHEPKDYPYLGETGNARYVDLKEWQIYALSRMHRLMLAMARNLDPERPMVLSPGSCWAVAENAVALAVEFGTGLQHTGRQAFYHPWWAGVGYVNGVYGTSEPGSTTQGDELPRMMGWLLFDGDSNHNLYWDIEDYIKIEKKTGWFTRNRRLIQLFGKYLREKPSLLILRSSLTMRLGSNAPWNWDIGRGEIQAAHYDNAYITERELKNGLADRYPVIFDSGSEFMTEADVTAMQRYVEQGGTFIALHNTGRHTPLKADSWPISRLTGFTVTGTAKPGKIRFGSKLPIFQEWANREFNGEGISLDYLGNDSAKGTGLALRPVATGALPLAKWKDGSVAVGYRQLGRGRVIVLGANFWRRGQDVNGVWRPGSEYEREFFDRLFAALGITRNCEAASPKIWTRKMIAKNGLQEMVIAFNSDVKEIESDVAFRTEQTPDSVVDMVSNRPVQFKRRAGGMIIVPGVKFAKYGVNVFGVRRASLAGGLPTWWQEKTTYWKRTAAAPKDSSLRSVRNAADVVAVDSWKFLADKDNVVSSGSAWLQPGFDDHGWRDFGYGDWTLLEPALRNYHGTGLYRFAFTLPESWRQRRIALHIFSHDLPIVNDRGEFSLNGNRIATYRARGWSQTLVYDVTSALRPGKNVLAVKVDGGAQSGGIVGVVWLAPERTLQPVADLGGEWQCVQPDYLSAVAVKVPGKGRGRFLRRDLTVPAEWQGKEIFLAVETPAQWLASVVVNGHPINKNSYLHPFGLITEINLTPYLVYDKVNRLELWPCLTIPGNVNDPVVRDITDMAIKSIRIGCFDGKRSPKS